MDRVRPQHYHVCNVVPKRVQQLKHTQSIHERYTNSILGTAMVLWQCCQRGLGEVAISVGGGEEEVQRVVVEGQKCPVGLPKIHLLSPPPWQNIQFLLQSTFLSLNFDQSKVSITDENSHWGL